MPSRSEIDVTPSSSAVSCRSPTAFASANGVGANADEPELLELGRGLIDRLLRHPPETSSGGTSKNEVSAVDVYSG